MLCNDVLCVAARKVAPPAKKKKLFDDEKGAASTSVSQLKQEQLPVRDASVKDASTEVCRIVIMKLSLISNRE